jgi:UDP-N-acetylmuramate-alanine ligase
MESANIVTDPKLEEEIRRRALHSMNSLAGKTTTTSMIGSVPKLRSEPQSKKPPPHH